MAGYSLDKAARILEWDRLAERLAQLAASDPGQRRCRTLPFLDDAERIAAALTDVTEARDLLARGVEPDFTATADLTTIAQRARVGSALAGTDLLVTAELLRASRRVKRLL
jgi:dsDNA-specific endonuclease/ATPase MutS2